MKQLITTTIVRHPAGEPYKMAFVLCGAPQRASAYDLMKVIRQTYPETTATKSPSGLHLSGPASQVDAIQELAGGALKAWLSANCSLRNDCGYRVGENGGNSCTSTTFTPCEGHVTCNAYGVNVPLPKSKRLRDGLVNRWKEEGQWKE
jgi:hypothetical protein